MTCNWKWGSHSRRRSVRRRKASVRKNQGAAVGVGGTSHRSCIDKKAVSDGNGRNPQTFSFAMGRLVRTVDVMTWAIRVGFIGLVGAVLWMGMPLQAEAQSDGSPEAIIELINEVKLGLQVRGGIRRAQQEALPLKNQTVEYLQRPMSGELSYSVPYYGVGLALRFRGVEVAAAVRAGGDGIAPTRRLQFRDGTDAIPFRPSYNAAVVRAEYFAFDWVGVGAMYQGSGTQISSGCPDCSFQINGTTIDQEGAIGSKQLFRARSSQDTYSLYVPVQKAWRGIRFFGRIGASVFARSRRETYRPNFARYRDPEQPREPTDASAPTFGVRADESPKPDVRRQFGRVGVGIPLGDLVTVRALFRAERLSVSGLTKTWSYEVGMEVGVPF